MDGPTIRMETGCGSLYITINSNGTGPIEVFTRMGKMGGCTTCQNDALAIAITTGLRYGVPVEEYIKKLKGIKCGSSTPGADEEDRILSCSDAMAKALEISIKK